MQKEITSPSPLLDGKGQLTQVGWARQPYLDCNLENARFYRLRPLQGLRIKRWDYYGVSTPDFFFSATLAHLGYTGTVFVYMLDYASGEMHEETLLVPLGREIHLARNSDNGDSHFDNGRVRVAFWLEGDARRVQVNWPAFNKGEGIAADFALRCPPEHESMVIVIPIGRRRFYYNRKVNCMPAEGWVSRGDRRLELKPNDSLGNLDWGRGVWDYRTFWIWASASAFLEDGQTVGLNLGCGFGDTSAATENAFILDGRIHKLDEVVFEYDPSDLMRPWRMISSDGRLNLEFVPFKERVARSNLLLVRSELHQIFGRYSGTLTTDDGQALHLRDVIGFVEEHRARW
ncbi:MAG: DUF2804 domain-containing protein [Dehalococcoidia bacterium]